MPPPQDNGPDHPIVYVMKQAGSLFMMLLMFPLLVWLTTSLLVPPAYLATIYEQEFDMNRGIVGFDFGWDRAADYAEVNMAQPAAEMIVVAKESAVQTQGDESFSGQLVNKSNRILSQSFYPAQEFYLPVVAYRSLILLCLLVGGGVFLLGSFHVGAAGRREAVARGVQLKPHRFKAAKMWLITLGTATFTYPVAPVVIPAWLILPLLFGLLHFATKWTAATMMEL